MATFPNEFGLRFESSALAISARRLWEHTELRQINPFAPITQHIALKPQAYVDVADIASPVQTLTGLTLDDVLTGKHAGIPQARINSLIRQIATDQVRKWLDSVGHHLRHFSQQRAMRNLPAPFLPTDYVGPLGVPGLHCALATWLKAHRTDKASALQWLQRIHNLAGKGLRAEEMEFSHLVEDLGEEAGSITGEAVSGCLCYDNIRISILPFLHTVDSPLPFVKVPTNATFKRIKPKLKSTLNTSPQWRDRVLGYWVDVVRWDDLLGQDHKWMAFTHRGQPVIAPDKPSGLCDSPEEAMALANDHARKVFPKISSKGRWSGYRLTGGEHYREWLVTLPYYAPSYFSSHFSHRNILLHVRCDIREGANGERVLLLQEAQSDWAQQARRDLQQDATSSSSIPAPPWLHEWPALALKLMLLHAAQQGADALAWTPGMVQVKRYDGLGATGLFELYDRTLPTEAARLLRPFGKACEPIEVFQPVNFYIEPADVGYEVWNEDQELIGMAATWKQAQTLLPDGAHEVLRPMHGIRLDETLRQAMLAKGFYAWGLGIH